MATSNQIVCVCVCVDDNACKATCGDAFSSVMMLALPGELLQNNGMRV